MQGTRFEYRKKKRVNRILNAAIGIVIALILFFAAQIFFGSTNSDETLGESEEPAASVPAREVSPTEAGDEPENDFEINDENEETDKEEELQPVPDGQWQPIGTEQTGEFSHDWSKGSVNWNEMTQALRYATGLGDDMIIWWLENGGSATSAIGTVSAPDQQNTPFQVKIEWIDGQGWMPVEKQILASNPYKQG